jgi:hypothetical protein
MEPIKNVRRPEKRRRRKRGTQPGNTNAMKHGFYARRFRPDEANDLEARRAVGLEDEIALLRVQIRRYFQKVSKEKSAEKTGEALDRLGLALSRLGRMVKTQAGLKTEDDKAEFDRTVSEVVTEILREHGREV